MPIARFQMPDGRIARFEVPEGTSPEQAQQFFDDFVKEQTPSKEQEAKPKTTFGEDVAIQATNALNTYDKWRNFVHGAMLSAVGREDEAAKVYSSMEKRTADRSKWANPNNAEQGISGKVVGTLATLPAQILTLPFSSVETGKTAIDAGESLDNAITASLIDTAGNVATLPLPASKGLTTAKRVISGAGITAGQEYLTKKLISSVMDTEAGKKAFDPTMEDIAVAAITGGGLGRVFKNDDIAKVDRDKFNKLREVYSAEEPVKKAVEQERGQSDLFNVENQGRGTNPNIPLDAKLRVDENGIPIREDLTQEIATNNRMLDQQQPDLFDNPPTKSWKQIDEEQQVEKQRQIDQMWEQRSPEVVAAEQTKIAEEQQKQAHLENLELDLSQERVSKGQQRKMNRGMGRGQKGALLFGDDSEKVQKVLDVLQDKTSRVSEDIPVEKAIEASRGEADSGGKMSTVGKYFGSGGVSEAMNRNSTMVLAGVRYVQNASKRADLWIRSNVLPLETTLRQLDDQALTDVASLIKDEAINKKLYNIAELENILTPKQLAAYNAFRKADKQAYDLQNAERVRMGKPPIPYNEWHAASRWQGDHRQPVKVDTGEVDKNGNKKYKVVGFLAADTKWGLEAQKRTWAKEHPEYIMNSEDMFTIKGSRRYAEGVAIDKAYSLALDLLGRDDPAVQKFAELFEQSISSETRLTAGQEKHFKRKAGVAGFVGDRPDLTFDLPIIGEKVIKRDPHKESRAFMQQQVDYLKNAAHWTEMQKAGENIKQLISDPVLAKEQKNNSAYLLDYWKTNLGFNESKAAKLLDDMFRTMGVSPAAINDAIGGTKTFFILQKLALSPGYIASNLLQTTSILPYLMDLRAKGYNGNPVKAIAVALPLGITMAHAHWARLMGQEASPALARSLDILPEKDAKFYAEALRFAEDNGTVSRSSYDESPIDSNRNALTKGVDFVGKATMAYPESIIRSVAFFSYVEMLKDSGKYKSNEKALFQHADELVSMSMVDYRKGERPMMFQKMGTIGNLANTLQTYPMSYYNQWRYFAKEAKNGNIAPFATAFALQMTLAGLMGIPGVSDADKLWQFIKQHLPAGTWNKIKGTPMEDPKLWLMAQPGGVEIVNGLLSSMSGVGMTSRMAAPSFAEMAQAPVGPLQDITKQFGDVASLAMDYSNKAKQAQAAMSVSPVATQGLVEQKMFPEQTGVDVGNGNRAAFKSTDLEGRDEVYTRTPKDQEIRNWGVRSNAEVVSKEAKYRTDLLKQITNENTSKVAKSFYSAIRNGNVKQANEYMQLYIDLAGKDYSASQIKKQLENEFMTAEMKNIKGAKTPQAIARLKLLQDVLNNVKESQ